ncbi:acyl carrier protein [Bacillus sp. 31A1R]|uniref:Acyl carrier protein n=1 Tax=Robertmurraya mangrovi TaxID=3098077 RepID=A0ABU5J1K4_9BACI|nr:acyl carrier protein [Bacillus sp. 31A1R]MDZ5473308.1 acyl carrier protein [Bacillus sp. 31A1R]
MREIIKDLVFRVIEEYRSTYEKDIPTHQGEDTPLFGKEGVLDSLGLVSFIVMIEQAIEDELNVSLILADERAMSQKTSPFLRIGLLIDYINKLIQEEIQV